MSEELNLPLVAVAIGFNDGANKGFWRIQPRDGKGQWMEMGGGVTWFGRDSAGKWTNIPGIYVGPTGKPGMARVLVKGQGKKGIADKVYEVPSHLLQNVEARLSEEYVKSKGVKLPTKDIFGNSIGLSPNDIPQLSEIKSYDITPEDERLARGELTDEERAAEADGREKSPLAKLPGGFESLNSEKAKELLRESGIEPDEFDKDADAEPAEADETGLDLDSELFDAAPSGDAVDNAVADVLGKAAFGDEIPDVDAIIKAAQAPAKPNLVQTSIADINPGDIIQLTLGPKDNPVLVDFKVTANKKRTLLDGSEVYDLEVDQNGRSAKIAGSNGVPARGFIKKYDIPAKPAAAPATPTKPAAKKAPAAPKAVVPTPAPTPADEADDQTPAIPATPATPAAKKPTAKTPAAPAAPKAPKAKKQSNSSKMATLAKGREDDGKPITPSTKSLQELRDKEVTPLFDKNGKPIQKVVAGKKVNIEDPDSIVNALLEENPQAKVGKDGAIILERGTYTDSNGDNYEYEVAVQKSFDNKFMERYSFTNMATGKKDSFYHYDYKDSFKGLYGESNGLYVFRDQLLGRSTPGNPNSTEIQKWFGKYTSLDRRIRYFRNKSGVGKEITDQTLAEAKNMKLLTEDEIVRKYLHGRARTLNRDGSVDQKFLQSFWEILDEDQSASNPYAQEAFVQLMSRLPDNEESRSLVIKNLRDGIKKRYNGTDKALSLATFATNIEKQIMSERFDIRDLERRPWASRNGRVILERGDKVRYLNSEGEESIGTIKALNPHVAGYTDTVRVTFADGTTANVLAAKHMDRLTGTDDEDMALTNYTPSPKGDAMRKARGVVVTPGKSGKKPANQGPVLDFGDTERRQDDNISAGKPADDEEDKADLQGGAPYLGSDGVDADAADATPEAKVGNVAALEAGDAFYSRDGEYLGSVVEVIEVEAEDGGEPGLAVYYIDSDGDELLDVVEMSEDRGPK